MSSPMKRVFAWGVIAILLLALVPSVALGDTAEITYTINCASFTGDQTGTGWNWNHATKTLTIPETLFITITRTSSSSHFGIILPDGATLVISQVLLIDFAGYSSGGTGMGAGIRCNGKATIKGGLLGITKDGGNAFAIMASDTLTLDNLKIESTDCGLLLNDDAPLKIFGNTSISASWEGIYVNGSGLNVSGSGILTVRNMQDGFDGAINTTNITTDNVPIFIAETATEAPVLLSNITVSGTVTLPENTIIPKDRTLTLSDGASMTIPSGKTLENKGTIIIQSGGSIANQGIVVNNGSITNNGIFNNSGTVQQNGTFSGTPISGIGTVILPAPSAKYYQIDIITGAGGTSNPIGPTYAPEGGSSMPITFTPNAGYTIYDVKVDGVSIGKVSSYTFTSVTKDHKIEVVFIGGDSLEPPQTGDANTVMGFVMLAFALAVVATTTAKKVRAR